MELSPRPCLVTSGIATCCKLSYSSGGLKEICLDPCLHTSCVATSYKLLQSGTESSTLTSHQLCCNLLQAVVVQ